MSNLLEVSQLAQSYQQQYELGQLSPAAFKELINDLNVVGEINENAGALQRNQDVYNILVAAVELAGSIG
jgi:hypothetical protein